MSLIIVPSVTLTPSEQALESWNSQWSADMYTEHPVATQPFNHVLGNLYIGGMINNTDEFKYIFCCTPDKTYRGSMSSIIHLNVFHDANVLPSEWLINDVVDRVIDCCAKGATYVHCTAGLNRSALIVALVLVKIGWKPKSAIDHLKAIRGKNVLSNHTFLKRILDNEKYNLRKSA